MFLGQKIRTRFKVFDIHCDNRKKKKKKKKKNLNGCKKLHFSKLPPTKSQMILNAYQSPDGILNQRQSYAKDRLTKTPKKKKKNKIDNDKNDNQI
jgi:hypothetical protein